MPTLAHLAATQLMPALERSQGATGTYTRGTQTKQLTMIPVDPDWEREEDRGISIEEWAEVRFLVSPARWTAAGLGLPEQADRFAVTMADGRRRTYALLSKKGTRPYDIAAGATHYALRMKWVKA